MSIDLYTTREMMEAMEYMPPVRSFLLDTFFPSIETHTAEYVDIDIQVGSRKLAPFVSPLEEGKVIDREGYTTATFKPPYVKIKRNYTTADVFQRLPGETIYQGGVTARQRADRQLANDLAEMRMMIQRREEWMAAQALTDGKITVSGDGVDAEIDFWISGISRPSGRATYQVDASTKWMDGGTISTTESLIIEDLRGWKRDMMQDSGLVPRIGICGIDVATALLHHDGTKELLDNRRVSMGEIRPDMLPNGVEYLGNLVGIDFYVYNEWYADPSTGTESALIADDHLILCATGARTARHYGMIQDLQAGNFVGQYFPKQWETPDPSVVWTMLQSAPLVVPHQIDAFLCIDDLAD